MGETRSGGHCDISSSNQQFGRGPMQPARITTQHSQQRAGFPVLDGGPVGAVLDPEPYRKDPTRGAPVDGRRKWRICRKAISPDRN